MNSRVSTSKKHFAINTLATLGSRFISIAVLIWVQQYLIKRIPIEEYSLLPIVYALIFLLPFFAYILTGGVRRYVTDAYASHQDDRITNIISSIFPFFILGGVIFLFVGILFSWKIDVLLNIDQDYVEMARLMLMLVVLMEVIRLITTVFSNGLFVKQKFVLESVIRTSSEILRVVLLFVFLFGISVSVVSVVAATVISGLVEIFLLLYFSLKLLPQQKYKLSSVDWSIVRQLLSFGGWSSLYGSAQTIRKTADPFILNRLSTPLDVACFHLGSLVPNRLEALVNQSFMSSIGPIIIGLNAEQKNQKLKKLYLRVGRFLLWGVLLVILPFFVHYETITILYLGEEYSSAGVVMLLLLATYPFVYGTIIDRAIAIAKNRMRSLAVREVLSAVINLSLTLLFVGWYQMGAIGSAFATFLVYGVGYVFVFVPLGKQMIGASWSEIWSEIYQPGLVPFLMALLTMQILSLITHIESWVDVILNSLIGGVVYLMILWQVLKDVDKQQLQSVLNKLLIKVKFKSI